MRVAFDQPIAHRGLHDRSRGVIENSRSAFAAAIAKNYAIECDVQLSRDGVAVVFHDDDLDRLTGATGPVIARTASELVALPLLDSATGEAMPLFTEFLEEAAGRTLLQIELKRQADAAATRLLAQRVMDGLAGYTGPVVLESFDPNLLLALRWLGCALPLGIITYRYDDPKDDADLTAGQKFVRRHLLHWPLTRFDFISCDQKALNLPAVKLFRRVGFPVATWTIKSPAQALSVMGRADQIVFEGFFPQSV